MNLKKEKVRLFIKDIRWIVEDLIYIQTTKIDRLNWTKV